MSVKHRHNADGLRMDTRQKGIRRMVQLIRDLQAAGVPNQVICAKVERVVGDSITRQVEAFETEVRIAEARAQARERGDL